MENPTLVVIGPNGQRSRVEVDRIPFSIGRQPDNDLVLPDSRTSRQHARILWQDDRHFIEDANSRHGVWLNGKRVVLEELRPSDVIEFGVADSYRIVFTPAGAELLRLVEKVPPAREAEGTGENPASGLSRLKAVLEIARTLQSSYLLQDVLNAVVDAALAITGAERGFLLLHDGRDLSMKCARDCRCSPLGEGELRVPRAILRQALDTREELFTMAFEPPQESEDPANTVMALALRSVTCVPLVRIHNAPGREAESQETATAGVIYMDSRFRAQSMAPGDRELLQTLAIEASIIIENARLLEEERGKKKIEHELEVARGIQQQLLPASLPATGWFRASGSSVPSLHVGGDYYDVFPGADGTWAVLMADVSGKGVSAALVASLLQGAFLSVTMAANGLEKRMTHINRFLHARLESGKYATVFLGIVAPDGLLRYVNAGHCQPLLVRVAGRAEYLESTGMPIGLVAEAEYSGLEVRLGAGDRVVIYTDGVTDAHNREGEHFGRGRLREAIEAHAGGDCAGMHLAVREAVEAFSDGAWQTDDLTLLTLEYRPE